MSNYNVHKTMGNLLVVMLLILGMVFIDSLIDYIKWYDIIAIWIISSIYAVLPDLDHHLGKLRKYLFFTLFTSLIVVPAVWFMYPPVYLLCYIFFIGVLGIAILKSKHRGFLHTHIFGLIMTLPLLYFNWIYFLAGIIGFESHLMLDKMLRKRSKTVKVLKKVILSK